MLGFSLLGEEVLQAKAYPIWDGLFLLSATERCSPPSATSQASAWESLHQAKQEESSLYTKRAKVVSHPGLCS